MKKKTTNIVKGVGTAMAVGSVVAAASLAMSSGGNAKKTMKKAAGKVGDFVDMVCEMM
ncbi:MAG: hypothetical protein LUH82_05285 [Clostridiales bacterium]|nr:hypothetical protein [Clostridiales bacterium]